MSESLVAAEATEEVATAEDSQIVTESTGDPIFETETSADDELLLGKYKTPDDLAKAYKELESKLGGKEEDLRKSILAEIEETAFKDRPATAGEYQLPETIDSDSAVDNDLLQWWSEHSFENGYGQEEFQKGIEMYMSAIGDTGPDLESESVKLGENSSARIESANLFANKFFPAEAFPAIERMCESHEGILALEHIMESMKDGPFSGDAQPTTGVTKQGLEEMMRDERYHNPAKQDRNFVEEVTKGYRALYG